MKKTYKKMLFYAWFITIMALFAAVGEAVSVDSISIKDTLSTDSSVAETISINLSSNNLSHFDFLLPSGAYEISTTPNFTSANESISIPLSCVSCNIMISYKLPNAATAEGGDMVFSRTLNFPLAPKAIKYSVYLPPGYNVNANSSADPDIVPMPTTLTTDGQTIIITWEQRNPVLPQRYFIRYRLTPTASSLINFKSNLLLVGFILSLAGFAIMVFLYVKNVKKKAINVPKAITSNIIPLSLLTPDERKIVLLLKEQKKPLSQKDIGKLLEWSKSKVSAIVTSLDYKKIVSREKHGRNYSVELIKNFENDAVS